MLKADQPIRLKGRAMSQLRERVFARDKGCVDAGKIMKPGLVLDDHPGVSAPVVYSCAGPLELSHDKPRSLGGEDTEENCYVRCQRHHRLRDLHGMPGHF